MAAAPTPAARATSAAAGRGLLLIVVAVAVGLLLLRATVDEPTDAAAGDEVTTETTTPSDGTDDATATTTGDGSPGTDTTVEGGGATDDSTVVTVPPAEVRPQAEVLVQVVNAMTGVNGAAGALTEQLGALGYVTGTPTNSVDQALDDSIIYYVPGYLAEANRLATELNYGIDDVVQPVPSDPASLVQAYEEPNLLVMLGVNQASAG